MEVTISGRVDVGFSLKIGWKGRRNKLKGEKAKWTKTRRETERKERTKGEIEERERKRKREDLLRGLGPSILLYCHRQ